MNIELKGKSIIGFSLGDETSKKFTAFNPQTGEKLEPNFYSASNEEIDHAVEAADDARITYAKLKGNEKAEFLRQIAQNIECLGDDLINRATLETGLPNVRFEGERGRTCLQLRLFADLIEEGSWVDARIDLSNSERRTLPKPDIRSMFHPIGAVVIFCASNFPLAFSVAGGDTASALAAGCPVIVNAHSAHPGTAELVGQAISHAVKKCDLAEGVFSLLFSDDYRVGQNLVKHPKIKAVGFTGSQKGGRALMNIAASRDNPIPVYAEMSSINPTFILPSALEKDYVAVAKGLYSSFTLGVGQFCTKPGVVFLPKSNHLLEFIDALKKTTEKSVPLPLLTSSIRDAYKRGVEHRKKDAVLVSDENETEGFSVNTSFFQTDTKHFLADDKMSEEIFGPTTLLVTSEKSEELIEIARKMKGQLTATIYGTEKDLKEHGDLIEVLETKVGRLIFNGFPTGVEVCPSMVHGGVYPSTSDSRSTSVGTRAIERFSRLVCYQDFPESLLPAELKDKNPLGIWRLINGEITKNPI